MTVVPCCLDAPDQVDEVHALVVAEAAGRLVQKQEVGAGGQRGGEHDALAVERREQLAGVGERVLQADELGGLLRTLDGRRRRSSRPAQERFLWPKYEASTMLPSTVCVVSTEATW